MPRYYVNIRVGDQCIEDDKGVYGADLHSTVSAVLAATWEALREGHLDPDSTSQDRLEITDEAGEIRATVPLTPILARGDDGSLAYHGFSSRTH